jgi:hypothetical protein
MCLALMVSNISVNFVFTGCVILSVIVVVVAIRWIKGIDKIKMKKDDYRK